MGAAEKLEPTYRVRGIRATIPRIASIYNIDEGILRRRLLLGVSADRAVAEAVPKARPIPRGSRRSGSDENHLILRAQRGDRFAAELLLQSYDDYLAVICRKWRHHGLGAEFDDLMQEARDAFMYSVSRFTVGRSDFKSYMARHVLDEIKRAVEEDSRTIRIPCHVQAAARKAKKLGLKTERHVAKATGNGLTAHEVLRFMRDGGRILSVDVQVRDEEGAANKITLLDTKASNDPGPESLAGEILRSSAAYGMLMWAMAVLQPRERYVLRRMFLDGKGDVMKCAELGREMGVSRERVRQIKVRALGKLKWRLRKQKGFLLESCDG